MSFETIPARDMDNYIGRAFIIDLRSREEFMEGHITGAVSVPYEYLHLYKQIPRDREVVLYCERGASSMAAARELHNQGYRVKTVVGGYRSYRGNHIEIFR